MKRLFTLLFSCLVQLTMAQMPVNWTEDQLMEPAALAASIQSGKKLPVIISIGPSATIPHSMEIGMVKEEANMNRFKSALEKLPRNSAIVIYCGCCPFGRCPNVRPAIDVLNNMHFTNYKLLNLPTNIKIDWIDKGYPVED